MARKMLIDATHPEETRVVVVNGNKVEEFDFDSSARSLITGNIYLAKVTRIEPSLQAAFVDYGGNRHGFLAFSEIHPDYYQIPQADRDALLQEEIERQAEEAAEEEAEDDEAEPAKGKSRSRRRPAAKSSRKSNKSLAEASETDAVIKGELSEEDKGDAKPEEAAEEVTSEEETAASEENATNDESAASDDEAPKKKASSRRSKKRKPSPLDDPREDIDTEEASDTEEIATQDDPHEEARPRQPKKAPRWQNRYKIQEVVKVRQILLVQVIKEERGNKGAALTTYLSLPGRYCVLMPNTARGGGISRKISNMNDRKRLRSLAKELSVPKGAGLIIRTAGAKQDAAEIERDYAFLTRQWNQIRELTLKSSAPASVYEESGPIKRAIRDLLTHDMDEVLVEGEAAHEEARGYMEIILPERVKAVKLYKGKMPLFSRYQVESYLGSMFNPIVQLKSGGYLVIGVTEALIAIDVNSGRSTREASIEETALKTNLEAAEEAARQMKLRDLAGLIVIDFIDMEQRRHQQEVENKLKESLRHDRARIQIGRISGFGLLEMSRQRLRTGLVEAITAPCPHCHGTGITRSEDSIAVGILRAVEEEIARGRSNEIVAHVSPAIANFLFNEKRENIQRFLDEHGVLVRIMADPARHNNDYKVEKLKNKSRPMPKAEPVTATSVIEAAQDAAEQNGEQGSNGRKRRRRGGRGRKKNTDQDTQQLDQTKEDAKADDAPSQEDEKPKSRGRKKAEREEKPVEGKAADEKAAKTKSRSRKAADADAVKSDELAEKPKRKRRTKAEIEADKAAKAETEAKPTKKKPAKKAEDKPEEKMQAEEKPKRKRRTKAEIEADKAAAEATKANDEPAKPKRSGWWNV